MVTNLSQPAATSREYDTLQEALFAAHVLVKAGDDSDLIDMDRTEFLQLIEAAAVAHSI